MLAEGVPGLIPGVHANPTPGASRVLLDVDQDGDEDLIVLGEEVLFVENLGNLQFARAQPGPVTVEQQPCAIVRSDEDGDGDFDLIIFHGPFDALEMSLFRNDSEAGLVEVDTLLMPDQIYQKAIFQRTDLDQDGRIDFLFQRTEEDFLNPDPITAAMSRGPFQYDFDVQGTFGTASGPVTAGDVTGDGVIDLIAQLGDDQLVLRAGVPGGGWASDVVVWTNPAPNRPMTWIELADLEGNGRLDLVISLSFVDSFQVFVNQGGAAFAAPNMSLPAVRMQYPVLFDLDRDGDLDLVGQTTPTGISSLHWMENRGGGLFRSANDFTDDPGLRLLGPAFDDLDGDGLPELHMTAASYSGDNPVLAWVPGIDGSAGASGLALGAEIEVQDNALYETVYAHDWDSDGDEDLVWGGADRLRWSQNLGAGRFASPATVPGVDLAALEFASADLDGDGRLDLLGWEAWPARAIFWIRVDPMGTAQVVQLDDSMSFTNSALIPIDADGDGDLDVLTVGLDRRSITMLEQVGPGNFVAVPDLITHHLQFFELAATDLDGDGNLDIIVAPYLGSGTVHQLHYFRGDGAGSFAQTSAVATVSRSLLDLTTQDLDGDGLDELVWIAGDRMSVQVQESQGNGTLHAPVAVSVSEPIRAITFLARPDGVRKDLAISTGPMDLGPGTLEWAHQFADLQFGNTIDLFEQYGEAGHTAWLASADFDGDGDGDLALAPRTPRARRPRVYPSLLQTDPGRVICDGGAPGSTGRRGRLRPLGDSDVVLNALALRASELPPGALTLFLASRTSSVVVGPGGSQGTLCLGGAVGRFLGPGLAGPASSEGARTLSVDLTQLPQPSGSVAGASGETWFFQAWHRDIATGSPTSNFTAAVQVLLR